MKNRSKIETMNNPLSMRIVGPKFSLSIQASENNYANVEEEHLEIAHGFYQRDTLFTTNSVEIAFIDNAKDSLVPLSHGNSVLGWVPVSKLAFLISQVLRKDFKPSHLDTTYLQDSSN